MVLYNITTQGEKIKAYNLIWLKWINLLRIPIWKILWQVHKVSTGDSDMVLAPEEFKNESLSI